MRRHWFWLAMCLAGLVASEGAIAAQLTDIRGEVLVNSGTGFTRLTSARTLAPGDTIIVSPTGSARLMFEGGCSMPVAPGQIVRVGDEQGCVATGSAAVAASAGQVPATGVPGAAPEGPPAGAPPANSETPPPGGISTTTWILGGVAVAAGVGLAVGLSGGGGSSNVAAKPASP